MDDKSLQILEFPKILECLAEYCDFPASVEKARDLRPTSDIFEARLRQVETREAIQLLGKQSKLSIGEARDVRASVDLGLHGGVLTPNELLDIKYTLVAARTLARNFERLAPQFPRLADIATQLPPPLGMIDAITKAISERGEILDSASDTLEEIRRDLRIIHDRLISKLQKMVTDPKYSPYLQEPLVTQRDGRYVLPLRTEFKGRIRSIIHDQSASGSTLFVEPLGTVELNNQYRELELAERDEVHRILTELSHQVGQYAYEITHTVEVIAALDLILARAKYAECLRATEPVLHPIHRPPSAAKLQPLSGIPQSFTQSDQSIANANHKSETKNLNSQIPHPGTVIRLFQARHPLLDQQTVVPIDVELDPHTYALVITGPNTGGKTVSLKTVGLLALMAQSGLHIPAQAGSEISIFDDILADIGDEQSIEQSLSTFSGHITNIIRILQLANPHSLVILDELGAGTDPQEGSALARALLSHLLERGITTLVTTHHPELKSYAHATPGITNACVEFDLDSLKPTFHLTIGLPGRSNALAIAERLGLPESIINTARTEIDPDDLRAEDLLDEILHQRDLARQARDSADKSRQQVDTLQAMLEERLQKIEDERQQLLEEARQEASEQLIAIQQEITSTRRALARARQPMDALKEVEEKVDGLLEEVEIPVERLSLEDYSPGKKKVLRSTIRLGDRVRLRNLGAQGVVSALSQEEAEVQVGVLRVRARLKDLELPSPSGASARDSYQPPTVNIQPSSTRDQAAKITLPESPGMELDIRGRRSDEALDVLEGYLDAAFVAGLPFVRIIHGKGTGKLRDVVRQTLSHHPNVRSYESGGDKEGGEGVTVVKLVTG